MNNSKKGITPKNTNRCIIIVPIYNDKCSVNDIFSLNRLFKLMHGKYDICAIYPNDLNINYYIANFNFDFNIKVNNEFFKNFPNGYNELLTNIDFYKIFENYEYILIHHLDSYLFKDELEYWCDQNFDYIGAPFIYYFIFNFENLKKYNPNNRVGNGGLSLRKVSWCINVLQNNSFIKFDKTKLMNGEYLNEDTFFANQKGNFPSCYIAQKFAWSDHPVLLYQINDGQPPFGAHRIFNYLKVYITLKLI